MNVTRTPLDARRILYKGWRTVSVLAGGIGFVVALLGAAPALEAIGPELPIELVDSEDEWVLLLALDPKEVEVTGVRVQRIVYEGGERLFEERIAIDRKMPLVKKEGQVRPRARLAPIKEGMAVVPLRLLHPKIKSLKPGAYSQKIVAEARWIDEPKTSPPLTVQRRIYFVVAKGKAGSKGKARRITLQEYSRIVDPSAVAVGPGGKKVLVKVGRHREEKGSIKGTKGQLDRPLGALGGVPLERIPKLRAPRRPDRSEANED